MGKGKYSQLIESYCQNNHITIPAGFFRRRASQFAIVKKNPTLKLIALTWFKKTDLKYYIENTLSQELDLDQLEDEIIIFDFKNNEELIYQDRKLSVRESTL